MKPPWHTTGFAGAQSRFGAPKSGIPLFVPLTVLLVYLLWKGYGFGYSDQDEVIPYLLRLLDPSLFAEDWFVTYQTEHFGPRTYFVWLAFGMAKVLDVYGAFVGLYLAAWITTACGVFALARDILRDSVAAAAAVAVVLLLTPKFTLGGNDLVASMLTPSVPAWSLAVWSLVYGVRGRVVRSAVLAGLATWLQAVVGLQAAMLIGLLLLRSSAHSRPPYVFALAFGLAALPALGLLAIQQLSAAPATEGPGLFYTLFEFRAPHHYLLTSFTRISALGFGLLVLLGLAGYRRLRAHLAAEHRRFVVRTLCIVAGCGAVSFVATEVMTIATIAKLQLFKMTVVAKVVLAILLCGAVASWLPSVVRSAAEALFDYSRYTSGAALLVACTLLLASPSALGLRPTPPRPLEEWARSATPRDAVFAVPPSWDGFRSQAQRAIVINYKAFPFLPGLEAEWLKRMVATAPITLPARGYPGMLDSLDYAFLQLSASELREIGQQYGASYFARNQRLDAPDFEVVHTDGAWSIYHMNTD